MNNFVFACLIFILTSCGGDFNHKVNDSEHEAKASGEVYSYVIIRLEFIQQISDICEASKIRSDFASDELYDKAVSDCVLDNLSVLDMGSINQFNDEICSDPKTVEELQVCEAIN